MPAFFFFFESIFIKAENSETRKGLGQKQQKRLGRYTIGSLSSQRKGGLGDRVGG